MSSFFFFFKWDHHILLEGSVHAEIITDSRQLELIVGVIPFHKHAQKYGVFNLLPPSLRIYV